MDGPRGPVPAEAAPHPAGHAGLMVVEETHTAAGAKQHKLVSCAGNSPDKSSVGLWYGLGDRRPGPVAQGKDAVPVLLELT